MNAILAIDGGGTRTRAGLYDEAGNLLAEAEGGPSNVAEGGMHLAVNEIVRLGRKLESKAGASIMTVCAGVAGAGMMAYGRPLANRLSDAFSTPSVFVSNDLYMMFHANCDASRPILVIAGTGSSIIARGTHGEPHQLGGLGQILGDEGSGYCIAIEGIRRALLPYGGEQGASRLMGAFMEAQQFPTSLWLFAWLKYALKDEIARLGTIVLTEAAAGNAVAREVVRHQAESLARLTLEVIPRAQLTVQTDDELIVMTTGGVFEQSSFFCDCFHRIVRGRYRRARLEAPKLTGHHAAFQLRLADPNNSDVSRPGRRESLWPSLRGTEGGSNERPHIDELNSGPLCRRMTDLELQSVDQLRRQTGNIGETIDVAAACLRAGGRIIYAGAGTSGRLGVLDASECPPTFGVDEGRVIGLIAGGDAALRHSIEGAEDDVEAARRDIDAIAPPVGRNDIVIGITASGTTPYALAAIDRAKELGAKTGLVACNPVPLDRADHVIALDTGPEVLPGSTRLKAGTATKIVLNQISTGAMAKAGYVFEGRMVGVRPLNKKLRQRCIRIIAELTKEDEAAAEKRLDETGGSIRLAVLMARKGLTLAEATRRLDAARGVLRDALEMK